MYTLMNKNTPLIDFEFVESEELQSPYDVKECQVYHRPWFISDLRTWLSHRHAPKHRAHIANLFAMLGLTDIKSLIDFSKGLALTDTLWVNQNDHYCWENINLFENEFDAVIAQVAFEGGLHGRRFSTTSPELTTEGAFPKCWVREDETIYLMKQGSSGASNAGLEPYSEQYCSELLDVLGYKHVQYEVAMFRGKRVSKCPLLTSQQTMLLPMSRCIKEYDLDGVLAFLSKHGDLTELYRMLIFDYLVVNDDRHLNNVGVVCDADTFQVKGLAPLFDHGAGLLPYAVTENFISQESFDRYITGKGPRFYTQFTHTAKIALRRIKAPEVKRLFDFRFRRDYAYALPEDRLQQLEQLVQRRARNLFAANREGLTSEFAE